MHFTVILFLQIPEFCYVLHYYYIDLNSKTQFHFQRQEKKGCPFWLDFLNLHSGSKMVKSSAIDSSMYVYEHLMHDYLKVF